MNCKTLAETIAETIPPCASGQQKLDAIDEALAVLDASAVRELAEDAAKHYRLEIAAKEIPKYSLPETPAQYVARLEMALALAGTRAALVFILRNA